MGWGGAGLAMLYMISSCHFARKMNHCVQNGHAHFVDIDDDVRRKLKKKKKKKRHRKENRYLKISEKKKS